MSVSSIEWELTSCDFIPVCYSNATCSPFKKPLILRSQPIYLPHGPLLLLQVAHPCPAPKDFVYIGMDGIHTHSIDLGAGIQSAGSYLVKQAEVSMGIRKEQLNWQNTVTCIKHLLALKKTMTKIPLKLIGNKQNIMERYQLFISLERK